MAQTSGIYGFSFTRRFVAAGLSFHPAFATRREAEGAARDLAAYNLVGTVSADDLGGEVRHRLEAVLSFIERLDVIVSAPLYGEPGQVDASPRFAESIVLSRRNDGGGAILGSDAFAHGRDSRRDFIDLAMGKLADAELCKQTRLDSLLFKCVETFRQRRPFIEISFFLLFSGLEAFARAAQNDYDKRKSATGPITKTLKDFGLNVFENKPSEPERSVHHYLHLRNALFHDGDVFATVNENGKDVTTRASERLFNLSMLVSFVVMKAVGFDDGHTNWDGWFDRQPII